MKTLILCSLLWALPGGDREEGLQHYAAGRFAEAAAAFERAIESEGDSAELQYNLALASWRAGDLEAAELAIEKYAARDAAAQPSLHRGLLGAVRFDEAKALETAADAAMQQPQDPDERKAGDPLLILGQALATAQRAKGHFVRGAVAGSSPELVRNIERTLRYIAELEKKIEELEKQREQQQESDENQDGEKSDEQKQDAEQENKEGEKQEGEEGKEQKDPSESESQPEKSQPEEGAEQPPEPEPGEKGQPEPKSGEGEEPQPQPEPKEGEEEQQQAEAAESREDAPGEGAEGRALTAEQFQRLLELLEKLDKQRKQLRVQAPRKKTGRDW